MLEGTDLSFAYSSLAPMDVDPFSPPLGDPMRDPLTDAIRDSQPSSPRKSKPIQNKPDTGLPLQASNPIVQQVAAMQPPVQQMITKPKPPPPTHQSPQYDLNIFNKQFEQEQRISALTAELQRQNQHQYYQKMLAGQTQTVADDSYWDKLISKKKDVIKFIHSGLIILFAISLHFVVDFLLKNYIQTHEISYQREVGIRVLYPLGILFVAWNVITFLKV